MQVRQHHHAAGAKKRDGARRHDQSFDFRSRTVQHGCVLVTVCRENTDSRIHRLPHQIPLCGIKIVHRAAFVGQLPEFCLGRQTRGPLSDELL